jgi:hypothetical protein
VSEKTVFIGFRAPRSVAEAFEVLARADERTTSAALRRLMVEEIDRRAAALRPLSMAGGRS